jgi:hypothetical protein
MARVVAMARFTRSFLVEIQADAERVLPAMAIVARGLFVPSFQRPIGQHVVIEALSPAERCPPHHVVAAPAVLEVTGPAALARHLRLRVEPGTRVDLALLVAVAVQALLRGQLAALHMAGETAALVVERAVAGRERAGRLLAEVLARPDLPSGQQGHAERERRSEPHVTSRRSAR